MINLLVPSLKMKEIRLMFELQINKDMFRVSARQAKSVFLKKFEKHQAKSVFLFENLRMSVFVSSNA